jgi:radical SAM protein with 4Fe4S-binding SPASM domain
MTVDHRRNETIEEPRAIVQWHLTARCQLRCAHCYMPEDELFQREIQNELEHQDCIRVMDDFSEVCDRWRMPMQISFSGGDPLLRPDLYDLIAYARAKGIRVTIMGNPILLTRQVARKLKQLGIFAYQVSIDGLEETHDGLRGRPGLFGETLRAIRLLKEEGIRSYAMFTLSQRNAHDLIEVIRLVAREGVAGFDFARLVPVGSGRALESEMLAPLEYRDLLLNVHEEYQRLADNGCQTRFGRKEHLWNLLYRELGLIEAPPPADLIVGGCNSGRSAAALAIGYVTLTILADGTVLSCRRLPISIGKVPEQSILEIFTRSEALNELRQIELMEKCGQCELLHSCRGCPAVAYAVHGSYFAPDPQCWKDWS